ncbi:MAG: DUF429 domain-containing protein [Parvularculaceae bacterium]
MTGRSFVAVGVDGCPAGWVYVERPVDRRGRPRGGLAAAAVAPRFADVVNAFAASIAGGRAAIMVDMPIGLAETGRRACEGAVRRALGPRRSSVFSSPRRPMLAMADYDAANRWGKERSAGGGLSRQAWNIVPKIREVDAVMTPGLQSAIGEAHPEAAFARLRGAPCEQPKRTAGGAAERRAALGVAGLDAGRILRALRERFPRKADVADDDVLDACVLSLTAAARLEGTAVVHGDGARDARGLRMEIWA